MKQISVMVFSLFIGLAMSFSTISDAEAKRLGGGKSFGSKIFQNKPAKRTSSADKTSKAQTQNAARKQALSKKGGMMGLLGGLMIGGLLGALFFGGAFENINFMDILLFGVIAFLVFKIFAGGRSRQHPQTANGAPYGEPEKTPQTRQSTSQYNNEDATFGDEEVHANLSENRLKTGKIPRNFKQKDFLNGAENVYKLLQKAWDNGDLADLRQFCTDSVFAELQDQIHARTNDSKTEIITLKSALVNVETFNNSTEATVVFTAELKEHENENNEIEKIQEAWYFVRPDNRKEHNWLLDAIQQLED